METLKRHQERQRVLFGPLKVLVDSDSAEERNQLRWPAVYIVAKMGIYGSGIPHKASGQVAVIIYF